MLHGWWGGLKANGSVEQTFRLASLFSGIGGFELGFEEAGFRTVFQCEIDDFCRTILKKHWPAVPKTEDIRLLLGADIPLADVWTAGFPCQDVSLARMGPRAGINGRQSALFFEFARLVGEGRPRVFVLENVSGLLSSHGGRDFGIVLSTLAELGYALEWRVLNSRYFGVSQSRPRIYIVGVDRDRRGPAAILFEPERRSRHVKTGRPLGSHTLSPFKEVLGHPSEKGPVTPAIAYCLYAESARHTGTDWSRNYVSYPSRGLVRRLTPREAEGVMAFPEDWTMPDDTRSTSQDLDTPRYHALGNAVTPPVACWLAKRIKVYLLECDASTKTALRAATPAH